ncbi:aspartate-trna ligase [Moniliophthora roreri]|nr:aspartate-trna ligase [Moniliophthora roreri]
MADPHPPVTRQNLPSENTNLSKSQLEKRARAAEKQNKAAEKAAKQQGIAVQHLAAAAAEVEVCTGSVQALLFVTPEQVSRQMVKWMASLSEEDVILVEGMVHKTPAKLVKSTSVYDVEVHVSQLHLISGVDGHPVFTIDSANCPDPEFAIADTRFNIVLLDTRLNSRTTTNQAFFKLKSAIGNLFRECLSSHGFIEIHSPKLQSSVTEFGASFRVDYFKVTLTSLNRLSWQSKCVSQPILSVYTRLPSRIRQDAPHGVYGDGFGDGDRGALSRSCRDVGWAVHQHFPGPARDRGDRGCPEGTLKLTLREALDLLVEVGVPREELYDIDAANEKRLGRIVKAKHDIDYFIINMFPLELRPFYTMPDPKDPIHSNSDDFFMRGEEILSEGQHIHEAPFLTERM